MPTSLRSVAYSCVLFSTLILFAFSALAQTNRGGISGTVTDATGAIVPGATVTVTNIGTNQSVRLTTSAEGVFTATSLEPVLYRVTVEAPGFKKALFAQVKVDTTAIATVNVVLEAGAIENTDRKSVV